MLHAKFQEHGTYSEEENSLKKIFHKVILFYKSIISDTMQAIITYKEKFFDIGFKIFKEILGVVFFVRFILLNITL